MIRLRRLNKPRNSPWYLIFITSLAEYFSLHISHRNKQTKPKLLKRSHPQHHCNLTYFDNGKKYLTNPLLFSIVKTISFAI
jgi:hypothetical protein